VKSFNNFLNEAIKMKKKWYIQDDRSGWPDMILKTDSIEDGAAAYANFTIDNEEEDWEDSDPKEIYKFILSKAKSRSSMGRNGYTFEEDGEGISLMNNTDVTEIEIDVKHPKCMKELKQYCGIDPKKDIDWGGRNPKKKEDWLK
tara:strand:- start:169 stop:600 length:432 start_codon:yes stop_codon:yes gene_type:complete